MDLHSAVQSLKCTLQAIISSLSPSNKCTINLPGGETLGEMPQVEGHKKPTGPPAHLSASVSYQVGCGTLGRGLRRAPHTASGGGKSSAP